MKTYEILEEALALIEDEKNWCQGDYKKGDALCIEGACLIASGGALAPAVAPDSFSSWDPIGSEGFHPSLEALEADPNPHIFNDSHSHAEVVALFQRAIRNEKAKAGLAASSKPFDLSPVYEKIMADLESLA